ncbi:sigma-54-dependent transcriptional regulator [Thiobacillus denitrificans]|uniref:sigma-54-dependent transcriptional regulator n=1 Tax=Thiobacillus denitrificans TaxID=36861 RepID=UPI00036EEA85|nr:sigma-54 dependent transcriptional regulator [Thiobacillus denitrificans]
MRILLVDDQKSLRRSLSLMLQGAGFETDEAESGEGALSRLGDQKYDLVITDLRMDGMSGVDLLREIKRENPALPVILITAYGSIDSAVDAMRLGAFDYLTKPFREQDILEKIHASQAVPASAAWLAVAAPSREAEDIVAETPQMRATLIKAERIARTDISVLITGETGTGKTRVARFIHQNSARQQAPFVSINCASLPENLLESELFGHVKGSFTGATESRAGLFEEADGGTLFLDEVDTLSPAMQAKLLSVLQEKIIRRVGSNKGKKVDIRIMSASNQDLSLLIEKGHFRSDLYFRLNGIRLHLPPLRERGQDLHNLLQRFLAIYAGKYGRSGLRLTPRAETYVLGYPYPGNIRQLESFVEQMAVFADDAGHIDVDALPEDLLQQAAPLAMKNGHAELAEGGGSIADSERRMIEATLLRSTNIGEAARVLGIGRTTLWRKMREYNLHFHPHGRSR